MILTTASGGTLNVMPSVIPFGRAKGHVTEKIVHDSAGRFYCIGENGSPCPDEYVGTTYGQVLAHRSGRHGARKGKPRPGQLEPLKRAAEALLEKIEALESGTTGQTDPYKERFDAERAARLRAERKLASLKRALA